MNSSDVSSVMRGYNFPDAHGRYGEFGGKFVPETLMPALDELEATFMPKTRAKPKARAEAKARARPRQSPARKAPAKKAK